MRELYFAKFREMPVNTALFTFKISQLTPHTQLQRFTVCPRHRSSMRFPPA